MLIMAYLHNINRYTIFGMISLIMWVGSKIAKNVLKYVIKVWPLSKPLEKCIYEIWYCFHASYFALYLKISRIP